MRFFWTMVFLDLFKKFTFHDVTFSNIFQIFFVFVLNRYFEFMIPTSKMTKTLSTKNFIS